MQRVNTKLAIKPLQEYRKRLYEEVAMEVTMILFLIAHPIKA